MASKKSPTKSILDFASRFVKDREGQWNHEEWEQALKKVEEVGVATEEEVKRHFGNVLEAAKYFYQLETKQDSGGAASRPRTAKPAAKAKAKSKPKTKAKAKSKPKPKSAK